MSQKIGQKCVEQNQQNENAVEKEAKKKTISMYSLTLVEGSRFFVSFHRHPVKS